MAARSPSPKKGGADAKRYTPGGKRGQKQPEVVEKPKPPPLPTVTGLTPEMVGELKDRFDACVGLGKTYMTVAQFATILESLGSNVKANDAYVRELVREATGVQSIPTVPVPVGSQPLTGAAATASGVDDPTAGYLDLSEFLSAAARHLLAQFASYESELIRGFELLDTTHSGFVSATACREAWYHAMGAGEKPTSGLPTQPRTPEMKAEIEMFIADADPKKTDQIDYIKFVKMMISKINEPKKKKKKLKKKKEPPRGYGGGMFASAIKK